MRGFLLYSFIATLALVFVLSPHAVNTSDTTFGFTPNTALAQDVPTDDGPERVIGSEAAVRGEQTALARSNVSDTGQKAPSCGWLSDPLACVGNAVLSFFGLLLWVAGVLLNQAVALTVIQMSQLTKGIPAIQDTWVILRDLSNIILIFTFLAIGISTILGVANYSARNLLPRLIVVALLINFSFFLTQVVVDVSNLLAAGIHQQMDISGQCANVSNTDLWSLSCGDGGISDSIMQALKLPTIYDPSTGASSVISNGLDNIFLITVFGTILVLIAAFVFFAAAILLIVRFAVLVFLMILSPAAFAFMVLPYTQKYWTQWRDTLLNQAFFAPIFLLFLYIAIKVVSAPAFDPRGNELSFSAAISGDNTAVGVFISYGIVIAFFIFAIVAAKKMGAYATDAATKFGGKMSFGAVGWGGRNTFGRGADRLARSKGFQEWAGKSWFGEQALAGTRRVARSSFDMRSTRPFGTLAKEAGVNAGEPGGIGGFEKTTQRRAEQRVAFGKSLDRSPQAREDYARRIASYPLSKGGSQMSLNTLGGMLGRHDRLGAAQLIKDRVKEIDQEIGRLTGEQRNLQQITSPTSAQTDRLNDIPGEINKLGTERDRLSGNTATGVPGLINELGLKDTQKQKY